MPRTKKNHAPLSDCANVTWGQVDEFAKCLYTNYENFKACFSAKIKYESFYKLSRVFIADHIFWLPLLEKAGGSHVVVFEDCFGAISLRLSDIYTRVTYVSLSEGHKTISKQLFKYNNKNNIKIINGERCEELCNVIKSADLVVFNRVSSLLENNSELFDCVAPALNEFKNAGKGQIVFFDNNSLSLKKILSHIGVLYQRTNDRGFFIKAARQLVEKFSYTFDMYVSNNQFSQGLVPSPDLYSYREKSATGGGGTSFRSRIRFWLERSWLYKNHWPMYLLVGSTHQSKALILGLLSNHSIPDLNRDSTIKRVIAGNADITVLIVGGSERDYVIRITFSKNSANYIINNANTLLKLAVGEYPHLFPKVLFYGVKQNITYSIESKLNGYDLDSLKQTTDIFNKMQYAYDYLLSLQKKHIHVKRLDHDDYYRLVERYFDDARQFCLSSDLMSLEKINTFLRKQMIGREIKLTLSHGDFKLGNILFEHDRFSGLIDWDLSEDMALPLMDFFALLTYQIATEKEKRLVDVVTQELWQKDVHPTILLMLNNSIKTFDIDDDLYHSFLVISWFQTLSLRFKWEVKIHHDVSSRIFSDFIKFVITNIEM